MKTVEKTTGNHFTIFSKNVLQFIDFFLIISPQIRRQCYQTQGAAGSEREWKDFTRNRKPNPKQGTRDKTILLFKKAGEEREQDDR